MPPCPTLSRIWYRPKNVGVTGRRDHIPGSRPTDMIPDSEMVWRPVLLALLGACSVPHAHAQGVDVAAVRRTAIEALRQGRADDAIAALEPARQARPADVQIL